MTFPGACLPVTICSNDPRGANSDKRSTILTVPPNLLLTGVLRGVSQGPLMLAFLSLRCSGPGTQLLRCECVEAGESQAGGPRRGSEPEDECQ